MSILDLIQRGNGRSQAKRAITLPKNVSRHDAYDRHMLADAKRKSPEWAQLFDAPIEIPDGQTYEPAGELYDDVWMSLHHHNDAGTLGADEVRPSVQLGRSEHEALVRTGDFQDLRGVSRDNPTMTSVAFASIANSLRESMHTGALSEHAERAERADQAERQAEQAQRDIDALRDEAKQGNPADAESIKREMKAAIADRQAARAQLAEVIDEQQANNASLSAAVAGAARAAAEAGKEAAGMWGDIASLDPAALKHTPPDAALALMEAWSKIPFFREFLKLIGRWQRTWRALDARKVTGGTDEVVGIEVGNDLTRILPSELMQLGHPLLRRKFLKAYIDEDLLQFQTSGFDKAADGPGVFLLDVSGSMKKNDRRLRAMGMMCGFIKLMHQKQRDAIVFPFNGSVKEPFRFPATGGMDMANLMALASLEATGGTDIHAAVLAGERAIARTPGFEKADIVVLTDGFYAYESARDEPIKARLADAGIRTHGVAVDHDPVSTGYLMQFCDDVVRADDLTTAAGHLVGAIA